MASQSSRSGSSRRAPEEDTIIGPFRRLENIGKGSFATVYRGIHIKHKSLVAIKCVQLYKLNRKLRDNLSLEIKILRSLQHPHIVSLIDCQETPDYMNIVMEFCELGDLSTFIKKRGTLANHAMMADMMRKYPNPPTGGLNEVLVRHFAKQMGSALEFLHSKNCIHRDLKPQNLLLNPSPLWYSRHKPEQMPFMPAENSLIPAAGVESLPMLKVADFGFARFLPQTSLAETLCGSPLYMAPEILRYEKYDSKADLWSVGTVLHELIVAKPPFRANNHVELLRKIELQEDRIRFPEDITISRQMKVLIRSLLRRKPVERMGFEEFFDDPVLRGPIPGLVGDDKKSAEFKDISLHESEPKSAGKLEQRRPVPSSRNHSEASRPSLDQEVTPATRARPIVGSAPASRPTTRPSSGIAPSRRLSSTPAPESDPSARRLSRPVMTSHPTAPARQTPQERRNTPPSTVPMERRSSRPSTSPSHSVLKEHYDAQRVPRVAEERINHSGRDKTDQEIAFEREYVMVEKRTVEVNALADEVLAAGRGQGQYRGQADSPQTAMVRRATTQGSPTSTTGAHVLPSRAMQIAQGKQRPDPTHQRAGSYERRYGKIPGSVSSAISNALNAVALRSGMGLSPPLGGPSPPKGYSAFPVYPTAQSSLLLIGDGGRTPDPKDEEGRALKTVEELAHRSNVVFGFAEVKYKQLLPAPPSEQGLGIAGKAPVSGEDEDDDDLTVDATIAIAEEALVLYVKAVAIISKSIDLAASWWSRRNKAGAEPRASPGHTTPADARMTQVVQWLRTRFNECIDKAEFSARKLVESQKQLPPDHPQHPSNRPSTTGSSTSIGSTDNIVLPSGVTAEKLMYDRAIEMSKAAAVNELVNEDLLGCELNYTTAIQMLQAILDTEEEGSARGATDQKKPDDDSMTSLDLEDREAIKKLIDSMKSRLKTLRKKIEIQKAQKRASLTAPPLRPSSGSSASTTPVGGISPSQR